MSATQSRSGPSTWNSRCTRSGAARAAGSRVVVMTHLRRLTPCTPATRTPPLPPGDPHEPPHALAADVNALGGQFRVHPGRPIGPPGLEVDRVQPHRQL